MALIIAGSMNPVLLRGHPMFDDSDIQYSIDDESIAHKGLYY